MRVTYMLLMVGLLLPAAAPCQGNKGEDPVITEFKKYIRSDEPHVRRDQIERLARIQTPESVELLIKYGLVDADSAVRDRAVASLAAMEGEARACVLEALSNSNPSVREGVALALGKMKGWDLPPVAELGARLAKERNEVVQAACAEAIGMLGAAEGTFPLIAALESNNERVVIAAADALAILKDPRSGAPLVILLDHASWRVQVAAIHALSQVRVKESVGPLIDYLDNAVGRPRQDAHRALVKITQRTFGMGAENWRTWWERDKDRWTVPPEKDEKDIEVPKNDGYARKPTRYHRIETFSKRIIFVIDVSSSIEETPILLKAGKKSGDTSRRGFGTPKLYSIAREELAFALRGMEPETRFNVIAFETNVHKWKKAAVSASPGNVQAALRWLEKQKARKLDSRRGGGRDKNGWMVGRTNTYGALAAVFGLRVDPKTGAGGTTTPGPGTKRRPRWDTCFFLSDGRPTEGVVTGVDDILQEVKRWNKTCKMVIHCIGMENDNGLVTLLQGLASATGGKCVFVGK